MSSPSSRPPGSVGLPWWVKLWRYPRALWQRSGEMTDSVVNDLRQRPGRWARRGIRAAILAVMALIGPWIELARVFRRQRERACQVLYRRVEEMWGASPFEAVALVRATYEAVKARGDGWKTVDLPPFGRFDMMETLVLHDLLFRCEFALGRYEEAMHVSASVPIKTHTQILEQVECLLAMGRRNDAIAHLEKNLAVDTWRGPLRRRLEELSGRKDHGIN